MRLGNGYSLDDVALATGIDRTKLSRGERGLQKFTADDRRRLVEFLMIPEDILFPDSPDDKGSR
jgi:transcriptional regulator with XRE-family HTH domain